MTAAGLTPTGPMLRLRVDGHATVVDVSIPSDTRGPRTGSPAGVGVGAWVGVPLLDHTAPSQREPLAQWLDEARSPASTGGSFLWRARRDDGLPLVLLLHALGGDQLTAQRAGGMIVEPGQTLSSAPPNTGPDHVLNHDVRGGLRNARAFIALYTRKLADEPAVPADPVPTPARNVWDLRAQPAPMGTGAGADRAMLAKAVRTLVAADTTVDGLVRFHRIDTDPLSMRPVSVGDLAVRAARLANEQLADLATMPDNGDLADGLVVHGPGHADDRDLLVGRDDLLEWVFAELCVNARKFGGPTVVSITTESPGQTRSGTSGPGSWVVVRVANSGVPIDAGLAEDAFGLGRLLQPRGERPGVGLGLPLCRRIVTRHAGAIRFVPVPEGRGETGSELQIELPLAAGGIPG